MRTARNMEANVKTICIVSGLLAMLGCLGCEKYEQPKAPEEVVLKSCALICTADTDCGATNLDKCQAGECVKLGCLTDADCTAAGKTHCNTTKNVCQGCLDDTHCTGGLKCHPKTATCTECTSSADCANKTNRTRCNSKGTCICAVDSECTTPHMQLCRAQGCVCSDNLGCAGTAAETCYWGLCAACTEDAGCASGEVCLNPGTADAACGCGSDANCADDTPYCLDAACVGCKEDSHCPGGFCVNNACVECTKNADCESKPFTRCMSGACVCKTDAECTTAKLGGICNASDGTCYCNAATECGDVPAGSSLQWACQ